MPSRHGLRSDEELPQGTWRPELSSTKVMSGPGDSEAKVSRLGEQVMRIRTARGWSQRQLADRSGVSSSTVSRLERGARQSASIVVAKQLAIGLECPVEDLIGALDLSGSPGPKRGGELLALQRALVATAAEAPPVGAERWRQTLADAGRVRELRQTCEYVRAMQLAAACMPTLKGAAWSQHRSEALGALAHLYFDVVLAARAIGELSTAWLAARECRDVAVATDDLLIKIAAAFASAQVALALDAPDQALRLVAAHLAGDKFDSPEVAALRGQVNLTAALSATRLADRDQADRRLRAAETYIPRAMGHADVFAVSFGATNVLQWRMSIALEAGDLARAADAVRSIDPSAISSMSRLTAYRVDLARLYAATGRDSLAIRMLIRAYGVAPEYCARNRAFNKTLAELIRRVSNDHDNARLRFLQASLR